MANQLPRRFSCLSEKQIKKEWDPRDVSQLVYHGDVLKLKDVLCEYPELVNRKADHTSLLHTAVFYRRTAILEVMFNTKGFDFIIDDYRTTQYHTAPLDILKMMVERYPLGIHALNDSGNSPLHIACEKVDVEKVEFLLQQPLININIQNHDGKLVEDLTNNPEIKALFYTYKEKENQGQELEEERKALIMDAVLELEEHHWTFYELWEMLLNKNFSKLKTIFKCDPEVINVCDNRGNTLLHTAVIHKYSPIVIGFLLEQGIDIGALNSSDETAYHIAANSFTTLESLLKINSKGLNIMNEEWRTPIHLICQKESIEVLALALKYPDVRVDAMNKLGNTADADIDNDVIKFMLSKYRDSGFVGVNFELEDIEKEVLKAKHMDFQKTKKEVKEKGEKEERPSQRRSVLTEEQLNATWDYYDLTALLKNDDVPKLRDIFDTQPNVVNNAKSHEGTLLSFVVKRKNVKMVKLMLEYGVDISKEEFSDEALESKEIFQLLCEANPKIWKGPKLYFKLCDLNEEHVDTMEYLLQNDPDHFNEMRKYDWNTPLHLACRSGHLNIVKLLLKQPSIDINIKNGSGNLPEDGADNEAIKKLIQAKRNNEPSLEEWMSVEREKYSALPNEELNNYKDDRFLDKLINNKDYRKLKDVLRTKPKYLDVLYGGSSIPSIYRIAVHNKELSLSGVDFIFQKGNAMVAAKIFHYDKFSKIFETAMESTDLNLLKQCISKFPSALYNLATPLHTACSNKATKIVKFLLEQPGINVNVVDNRMNLAEDLTNDGNIKDIVKRHRKKGKTPNRIGKQAPISLDQNEIEKEWTFFELLNLLLNGQEDALEAIFAENSDLVNIKHRNDSTMLHFAVALNLPDCARFLLKHGANCKSTDNSGQTPYHVGVLFKDNLVALIEHDPSGLNIITDKWNTPLHYACRNGAVESVEYLLQQKNIRADVKNKKGKTAMELVVDSDVKMLLTSYLVKNASHKEI